MGGLRTGSGHRGSRRGRSGIPVPVMAVVGLATLLGLLTAGAGVAAGTPPPATVEAWVYPTSLGQPACAVPGELAALAVSPIAVLKPEYLTVNGRGRVVTETAASLPCNGYSAANLAAVRSAANRVYVTVSAGTPGTRSLLANGTRSAAAASSIEAFVASTGMDGVDLDFEPSRWSPKSWGAYMGFVSALAGALHAVGRTVEVDLGAYTATPWDAVRYGDVAAAGGHVVVMAYDHEFDVPCAPISPYSWLQQVVAYAQSQVPAADLTVGIPSYGYTTTTCRRVAHVTSNVAYTTMELAPGFPSTPAAVAAQRDGASGEIRWSSGTTHFDVVDASALDAKLAVVQAMGVTDVSVWSLGGEPWFTGNPG